MFTRKRRDGEEDTGLPDRAEEHSLPLRPGARPPGAMQPARPASVGAAASPAAARAPDALRPSPGSPVEATLMSAAAKLRDNEARRLIVGRDISLSGDITSCDELVVEGSVEANIANCRQIEIAETGLFKGAATIEEAEVRGRFEGTLTVRGRLYIRNAGKVTGTVRYGQIEIERGGQISGNIEASPSAAAG
jgi:cytoskeletal protein CcmA (bactofilin family)